MSLTSLLKECHARGIYFELIDNKVKIKAPEGVLTPAFVGQLKAYKKDILVGLQKEAASTAQPESNVDHVLSYNQRRLWFIEQVEENTSQFNLPLALSLKGPLNKKVLHRALVTMLERHHVLRTAYEEKAGEPYPVLLPVDKFAINEVSYRGPVNKQQLENDMSAEASRSFDLSSDYMLRVHLYKFGAEEHVILFNIHHIATDGWSLTVFTRELAKLYNSYLLSSPNPLPVLTKQYADFARWQNKWLSGSNLDRHLTFWNQQLKDAPPLHNLPLDHSRPIVQSYRGGGYVREIPPELGYSLERVAREQGATMYMLLQTAFATVIGRYSQSRDVVMGSPIANRNHKDFEGVMGYFVNTLTLRTRWEGSPSFAELLRSNKRSLIDAFEYQSAPYERLLEELKVERSFGYNSLFQILFILQNNERADDAYFDGLAVSGYPLDHSSSQFDITLSVHEFGGKYALEWSYASDIFDHASIVRLSESYELLLSQIARDIETKVDDIDILPMQQKVSLQDKARLQPPASAGGTNVCKLIDCSAVRSPDAVAVQHGLQVLTYAELVTRANQLAWWLTANNIGKGSLVAISLPRCLDMSVAILAVMKSGAAYLPIDSALPESRKQFLLEDSHAAMILCRESTQMTYPNYLLLDDVNTREALRGQSVDAPPSELSDTDLAYVNYTSGTTGKPKGVMVSHGNLYSYCLAAQQHYQIAPADRILQTSSFSFDACVEEHFMALVHGAAVVYRDELVLADWQHFNDFVAEYHITVAGLPTAVWNSLCTDVGDSGISVSNGLRLIILGGEALTASRLVYWKKHIGESIKLLNTYGPTETTIIATAYDTKGWQDGMAVPIGQPLDSHRCYVLDAERRLVPTGVIGELCIAGPAVSQGYINHGGSSNGFIRHEVLPGLTERLYCTGDKVRMRDSGDIEFLGRGDAQIKIRGFRIEPSEIEGVLNQHPDVVQALVIAKEYPGRGKTLIAYIVLSPEGKQRQERVKPALWQQVKSELPDYMLPAQLLSIESIPLTVHGKLDRTRLPEPDFNNMSVKTIIGPHNSIEQQLLDIWQPLLKLDRISTDSNFFELGGHSLLGVKLIAKIKDELSLDLSVRDLFEHPTIQSLALRLKRSNTDKALERLDLEHEIRAVTASAPLPLPTDMSTGLERLSGQLDNKAVNGVLLTGSTGFVGAFILSELLSINAHLKVYCLVRASGETHGVERIVENMASYGLWQAGYRRRIIAIPADLREPDLGLEKREWDQLVKATEWIIHNGAQVNHIMPYSELKPANVESTQSLLRLAAQPQPKLFSYISTTGIFMPGEHSRVITEDEPIDGEMHLADGGYRASKWVAEGLVLRARKQGLPCHIFRLGRVSADSETGACSEDDVLARYIKSCTLLGGYPEAETVERMVPVNIAAKVITALSIAEADKPQNFHLVGKDVLGWNEILCCREPQLRPCSYEKWLEQVELRTVSDNPLPISPYLLVLKQVLEYQRSHQGNQVIHFEINQCITESMMGDTGVSYPSLTKEYCLRYLSKLYSEPDPR